MSHAIDGQFLLILISAVFAKFMSTSDWADGEKLCVVSYIIVDARLVHVTEEM